MTEISFYLPDEYFEKLADLKEQETDPDCRSLTYNEYARELLEQVIWMRHKRTTPDELPFN